MTSLNSWQVELWNQLLYDCCCYEERPDETEKQCIEKSTALRKTLLPTVKGFLKQMYEKILNTYSENVETMEIDLTCRTMDFKEMWTSAILTTFDAETKTEKMNSLINDLAESFRKTYIGPYDWDFLLDVLSEPNLTEQKLKSNLLTYEDCIKFYNSNFTREAKAAAVFVNKCAIMGETAFSLPKFVLENSKQYFPIEEDSELNALRNKITDSVANLSIHVNISAEEILDILTHSRLCNDEYPCPKFQVNMTHLYLSVLKTMKFTFRPYDYKLREVSDKSDLIEAGRKTLPSGYYLKDADFEHHDPSVLDCQLGHQIENGFEANVSYCNDIMRTFTFMGMGYTINAVNFYEIYKKTPTMDIFCNEIVKSLDKQCNLQSKVSTNKIEINGPRYAIRLLLHVPNDLDNPSHSLYIHHSKSVSFLSGNVLKVRPGTHNKVVVTPRVTITDDSLAKADILKKKCFSIIHDKNPLALFKHYSKENCLFECRIKNTRKQYGCIPWDFPMLSADDNICQDDKRFRTVTDLKRPLDSLDCSHCIDDCDRIDYDYTINMTPLQDICDKPAFHKIILKAAKINSIAKFIEEGSYYSDEYEQCRVYSQKRITMVDIYVGPSKAVHITRSPRVTFLQQVANLGMYSTRCTINA